MPLRGEVWWAALDPVVGAELGGGKVRPVLILSTDRVNTAPTRRVVAVPATSTRHAPAHQVAWRYRHPRRGPQTGYFSCLDVRSLSIERLRGPFVQPSVRGAYRPPSDVVDGCLTQLARLLGMEE